MASKKSSSRDLADVWGAVWGSVVREMCGGNSAYTPVPILSEDGRNCLPLQVFTDAQSINSGSVVKLDHTQERLLFTAHDRESGLVASLNRLRRRYLVRERHRTSSEEITLLEETSPLNGPNNFEKQQKTKCFLGQTLETIPGGGYQTTFKLGVYNVRIRKVDPRKLLDCRIKPTSPVARLIDRRTFYMVYETHVAEEITCHVKLSQINTKNDVVKDISLKECPIVFRFVEIRVDRQGVVKDMRFNVSRHELMFKVKGRATTPSMKILA